MATVETALPVAGGGKERDGGGGSGVESRAMRATMRAGMRPRARGTMRAALHAVACATLRAALHA
eukprot:4428252-Pleurochrysis_carterae.AAC.1